MREIKVFHGSDHILKEPYYMGGKDDNDYGNGFYTTEYEERAVSWAVLNGKPENSIVNIYRLNMDGLNILDLNSCGILAWIAEVVANRGTNQESTGIVGRELVRLYRPQTDQADIIKGYRADDSYTQVIEAFLLNQINISEVERMFYKGSLGNQIFLKSPRAFEHIRWEAAYSVTEQGTEGNEDMKARREVNRFLSERTKAILVNGYQVPGITARYAINHPLVYHKEEDYYDNPGL